MTTANLLKGYLTALLDCEIIIRDFYHTDTETIFIKYEVEGSAEEKTYTNSVTLLELIAFIYHNQQKI